MDEYNVGLMIRSSPGEFSLVAQPYLILVVLAVGRLFGCHGLR